MSPVIDDLTRFKVIGWASPYGAWANPAAVSDEPCLICDKEFNEVSAL